MTGTARGTWRAAVVLVGALALAGCTGDDGPDDPPSTPKATAAPTSQGDGGPEWTTDELVEAVFARPETDAIATADGEFAYQSVPAPARVDVLELTAGEQSTSVVFRLTSLADAELVVDSDYLSPERTTNPDVRGIALQVPAENRRLRPYLAVDDDVAQAGQEALCLCSRIPMKVFPDQSLTFTATFAPLAPGTTSVDLEVVGFPLLTGVPVSRD